MPRVVNLFVNRFALPLNVEKRILSNQFLKMNSIVGFKIGAAFFNAISAAICLQKSHIFHILFKTNLCIACPLQAIRKKNCQIVQRIAQKVAKSKKAKISTTKLNLKNQNI